MSYFSHCATVEESKAEYKRLALLHHPDRNPASEIKIKLEMMKEINNQYERTLQSFNGQTSKGIDDQEHTYKYDEAKEREIMEMIEKLIAVIGDHQVEIMLIGKWIWLLGKTKPIKDQLHELKCIWHRDRACWFWRSASDRGYGKGGDLDELARKYGAENFTQKARSRKKAVKSA